MENTIKIIIVDDEELFRKGILFLLEREKCIEVIFEASNGQELLNFLKTSQVSPDIILMDLNMPLLNGVEATKIIHKNLPEVKIIALTSYNSKSFIMNMIEVGAASYLVKNSSPTEMLYTIFEVDENGFYYNKYVLDIIQEEALSSLKKRKSFFDEEYLTIREREVLQLICEQKNTNEIADELFISPRTVEGHRNNLLLKTESKNVAGLVVYALQNEIIKLEEIKN